MNLMKNGDTYVNVHSESYPDGEIRGQIMKSYIITFSYLFFKTLLYHII
ncbi:MAG: CHRD domain-containing protein [Nitrososphaeraceae archaeon]